MRTAASRMKTCSAQKPISGAADTPPTSIQYVSADHRGADTFVAEEFLDGASVVSILEKVGGKAVAERMATGRLLKASLVNRLLGRTLDCRRMKMVTVDGTRFGICVASPSRKDKLPRAGRWIDEERCLGHTGPHSLSVQYASAPPEAGATKVVPVPAPLWSSRRRGGSVLASRNGPPEEVPGTGL
jgi:hypothetical protein